MKRLPIWFFGNLGIIYSLCAMGIGATVTPAHADTVVHHLTIIEDKDTKISGLAMARYQFGEVNILDNVPIEHIYLLRNDSDTPMTLDHLQPSCGCTTAFVGESGAPSASLQRFEPGKVVKVHVSINPAVASPGLEDKFVQVFIQGQAEPAANLEITGQLSPGATCIPSAVNFGVISADSSQGISLVAKLDRRLATGTDIPHLVSASPDVVLMLKSTGMAANNHLSPTITQTYEVHIAPHAHLGILQSTLIWNSSNNKIFAPLARISIPVVGEVRGDISAVPAAVSFGMVTLGNTTTHDISILGITQADTAHVSVSSGYPALSARWKEHSTNTGVKADNAHKNAAVLELTLGPDLPTGTLETQLIVTTPLGAQLLIPVSAFIMKN